MTNTIKIPMLTVIGTFFIPWRIIIFQLICRKEHQYLRNFFYKSYKRNLIVVKKTFVIQFCKKK